MKTGIEYFGFRSTAIKAAQRLVFGEVDLLELGYSLQLPVFVSGIVTITTKSRKNGETTLSPTKFAGYVRHVTTVYFVECLLLRAV